MSTAEKADAAVEFVRGLAARFSRPVVYSSFGKDSMVLLDIVERAGLRSPVIFHREAVEPQKYAFADRVIAERGYVVYDWPPLFLQITKRGQEIEIINWHQSGVLCFDYLPIGIRAPRVGEAFTCGLSFYNKPTGPFDFPWDLGLIGHKSSDTDPILGRIQLRTNFVDNSPLRSLAFPLADFTDEDVWEYTLARGLPINRLRYVEENGWKESNDISANPDWFTTCTACMDRDNPPVVRCPLVKGDVPNIAADLSYVSARPGAYIVGFAGGVL